MTDAGGDHDGTGDAGRPGNADRSATDRPADDRGEDRERPAEREEELAERIAELEETLAALRSELRESRRGPFGLPRPPSPAELLRLTERHAIPTAIAVLEAQIEALKLLRRTLRLADPERAARDGATSTRDRAERAGEAVLDRLDGALEDLQAEIDESGLPPGGEARSIVEDARRLTREIDDRLRESRSPGSDGVDGGTGSGGSAADGPEAGGTGGVRSTDSSDDEAGPVQIDVEGELQSIKDELDEAADGGESDGPGDDGPEDADDDVGAGEDA